MFSGRLHILLAAAGLFVLTALTGLQTLADAGVERSAPDLAAAILATVAPEPADAPMRSFAERLAEAGSLEWLVASSPDGWVPVGAGVDYSYFQLAGPVKVHVARMDRSNPGLFLETSIGLGRLTGGTERTSSQFARYEGAINYWGATWGNTNDVLVAINGSFYDGSGIPDRGMIHSGWYAKRFSNNENGSGFVWKLDRTAFIGQCVFHTPANQLIIYADQAPPENTEKFQGINRSRGNDELVLYTAQYDKSTQTDTSGVEILVRLDRPMLVLPPPSMAMGTVVAVRDQQGNTNIPFDHVVLSATGSARTRLLANLSVGAQVGISNSITSLADSNCIDPIPALDWTKAYASLGGSYYYLRNGQITSPASTPLNPLTSIAFNDQYIFFIVVDGRAPGLSIGMTIDQLANFAKNTLGATYGINQDGGGSSTMVIDGMVVNSPSDMFPAAACHQVYLPIIVREFDGENPLQLEEYEEVQAPLCNVSTERPVANGMMIVALQPKTVSTKFSEGAGVVATAAATVRLGPGSNFSSITTVAQGTGGVVQGNANGMNGVYAKGTYWWLVDFGSVRGWVSEGLLGVGP